MTGKKLDSKTVRDVKMHEHKEKAAHKVGDAIERAGEKLTEMGATKTGRKVRDAGDRLEHSQDLDDADQEGLDIQMDDEDSSKTKI